MKWKQEAVQHEGFGAGGRGFESCLHNSLFGDLGNRLTTVF